MKITSFEELQVWQKAHELTLLVYRRTAKFPREEQFGLVSQLRRASSSVAANIAEGYGRRTTRELLHSLRVANGETEETPYCSRLSKDLSYIGQEEYAKVNRLCESVNRLLSALGRSLNGSSPVTSHQSRVTLNGRRQR